ncbi:MAG: hypothetical protein ABJA83_05760 [Burkholderiaceae bacterium]
MSSCGRLIIALLSTSIAAGVAAQTSVPPLATRAMPKTADSQPAAETTSYRSVFDGYVATSEDKPVSWREANGLVGSIGGWRVYARESQQPQPPTSANTAPAARTGGNPAPADAAPPPATGSPAPHQKH